MPVAEFIKEQHIKFRLLHNNKLMEGIGFNMAEKFYMLGYGQPINIVYTLDWNEWNGQKTIQMKMIDMRLAEQ